MKTLVITIIGKDRPGIVDQIASSVRNHQGNWLGCRFANMAGQFAGFVEVDVEDQQTDALVNSLNLIGDLHVHAVDSEKQKKLDASIVCFSIMGNDKPGIVNELTSVLQQFSVNIIDFNSECISAPNWGNLMFQADFKVAVLDNLEIDDIREAVEAIANDLVVDIEFD